MRPGELQEAEVERLAFAKAQQGASLGAQYVIGADTLVALPERIFGKPGTPQEAMVMLRQLRGREHRVVTGVAVVHQGALQSGWRATRVWMRDYSDAEIAAYVASGEAMDKAGGYAIQDERLRPVERLLDEGSQRPGCYCNVVGLPLGVLLRLLREADYPTAMTERPVQCAECPDWARAG